MHAAHISNFITSFSGLFSSAWSHRQQDLLTLFFLLIHSGSLPFPRGETDQKTTELVRSRRHCAKRQQAGFHCITDPSGDKSAVHTGMKQVIPLGIRTGSQDRMAGLQITVGVVLLQKEEY
jgi:hypothetical protein